METPTIVLMLKAPIPGLVKTRLAKQIGANAACNVYRNLVAHQMRNLPPGMPVEIHFAPSDASAQMQSWLGTHPYFPQVEGDLGARLVAAMHGAFDRGAASVIFLGGDCPAVDYALLCDASARLREHVIVIGPAIDGGYYLLGTTRCETELFNAVEWSTGVVFEQTLRNIAACDFTVSQLQPHEDVDDLDSWERARKQYGFPPCDDSTASRE